MSGDLLKKSIVFIVIVIISNASILSNKYLVLVFDILFLFLLLKKGFIKTNIILFFLWTLINILVIYNFNVKVEYLRIATSFILLLFLPYFALSICKNKFWIYFEKISFYLSFISIFLFILNILFPSFFDHLLKVFKILTDDKFYSEFGQQTYWTSLIYVHMDNSFYGEFRNAGYMWEPGAFAWMIILSISIYWLRDGVQLSKHFFVYLIALLTTLSTSGYIAITVLISGAIISKRKLSYIILIIPFLVFVVPFLNEANFVGGEIRGYVSSYESDYIDFTVTGFNAAKLDRFLFAKYQLIEVLKYPLGFGIYKPLDIQTMWDFVGVNGLTDLLFMWGVPCFILLMVFLWRYFTSLSLVQHSIFLYIAIFISNLMMIFSNPAASNPIIYFMLFTPLMQINFKSYKT